MPIVMESSMFCYSVDRFISNHAIVGYNFVKVYGSACFINPGDDLYQEFDMCVFPA